MQPTFTFCAQAVGQHKLTDWLTAEVKIAGRPLAWGQA